MFEIKKKPPTYLLPVIKNAQHYTASHTVTGTVLITLHNTLDQPIFDLIILCNIVVGYNL